MYFGRGKNKIQNAYTLQDMYKAYISKYEEDNPYYVSYDVYKSITTDYFKKVIDILYDQSFDYKLPNNLGRFQIVKKKRNLETCMINPSQIDWENTVKYGKKIYHVNEHSDGYRYYFMWDKKGMLRNITKYRFVPTRANKRKLAYYVKNRIRDYFEKDYKYGRTNALSNFNHKCQPKVGVGKHIFKPVV